jgi:hypothetical protein|tara:strand:- start:17844 stop:19088 length:1245 start_codon:yes stop_codon:yes gene_type:complete
MLDKITGAELHPSNTQTPRSKLAVMPYIYRAIVKENSDVQMMGRLRVFIPGHGHPGRSETWPHVQWLSPFAGATRAQNVERNFTLYEQTQKAYGLWMVPPDVENEVLVSFIDGDINQGVCLGCFFQQDMNFTVPGIPAAMTYSTVAPGAEKNKYDKTPAGKRPAHDLLFNGLQEQGLVQPPIYDCIRGLTTSGAQRETPSRVYGFLSPEQHQIVIDDGIKETDPGGTGKGLKDAGIRFRTAGGAQILINDEFGLIYLITKSGNTWIEMTNEGKIDVYAKDDISYHTEKDFNIHTGGNFNIHSRGNINIRSEGSDGMNVNVSTGKLQMKSTGNMILQTDADGNIITAGQAVVKSSRLDLNGGSATDAVPIEPGPLTMNTSVLQSICTRVPEHEPWKDHESQKIVPKGEGLTPAWT